MIKARYAVPDLTCVLVTLQEGDHLGTLIGPLDFPVAWPAEGNAEHDALAALVQAKKVVIANYASPPAAVPASISDRQFAQVLALDGIITEDEALAWAARGDLPKRLIDALGQIPDDDGQRFGARMMLSAATNYERHHPLVPMLGALLGMDAAALDAVWTRGAEL